MKAKNAKPGVRVVVKKSTALLGGKPGTIVNTGPEARPYDVAVKTDSGSLCTFYLRELKLERG